MNERRRPRRWPLLLVIVCASATALFVGAAIAASSDGGGSTPWLLAVAVCFGATVAFGGVWATSRGTGDLALERAETAERLAEELRGPLLSLRSLSASAQRGVADMTDDDRVAFFTLIDEEVARLRRTLDQLTTALRIEAGGLGYDLREEDLGALIEEAAAEVPHGDHPLRVEVEPDLPVLVDRLRLGEALAAVVDNAARYSPPDAPIELRAYRSDDGSAVVEIADHGPGIPLGNRLEVFRRGATWRPPGYEETPGARVGLFVARAHVLGHGGTIELADRPETDDEAGPGTVVRITLPSRGAGAELP